jgi:hypothetical protein
VYIVFSLLARFSVIERGRTGVNNKTRLPAYNKSTKEWFHAPFFFCVWVEVEEGGTQKHKFPPKQRPVGTRRHPRRLLTLHLQKGLMLIVLRMGSPSKRKLCLRLANIMRCRIDDFLLNLKGPVQNGGRGPWPKFWNTNHLTATKICPNIAWI